MPTLSPAAQTALANGTVTQLVEAGGTGAAASNWPASNPTATDWHMAEHRGVPGQPSSEAMHKELQKLRFRAGVLKTGVALGRISLYGQAFLAGWWIGSEIRNQWVSVDVPAGPAEGGVMGWNNSGTLKGAALIPVNVGATVAGVTIPAEGFVVRWVRSDDFEGYDVGKFTECAGIPAASTVFVAGASFITSPGAGSCSVSPALGSGGQPVGVLFVPAEEVLDPEAARIPDPVTGVPTRWFTPDNDVKPHEGVHNKVVAALGDPGAGAEYPNLIKWINAQLDPDAPDPTALQTPEPLTGETYPEYVIRLRTAGFLGTITMTEVEPGEAVPSRGPRTVVDVFPRHRTRVYDPAAPVEVFVNPRTFPDGATDEDPDPDGGGGDGGDGGGEPPPPTDGDDDASCGRGNVRGFEMGALTQIPHTFPFGIPFWIWDALQSFVGSGTAPIFTIHLPGIGDLVIDFAIGNSAMAVVRPVIIICAAIGMLVSLVNLLGRFWVDRKAAV